MNLNINVDNVVNNFSNTEVLALLATCIEASYRYDFERIARQLNMQGRSVLANRGSYITRYQLVDFIISGEEEFTKQYTLDNRQINDLIKKRRILEQSIEAVGFSSWLQELLKIYNLTWFMNRVAIVINKTRPSINLEEVSHTLNISLEIGNSG
jgi:hypothetical protein